MFIRPTVDELESFGETDWLILCIPSFKADPREMEQDNIISLSLILREKLP